MNHPDGQFVMRPVCEADLDGFVQLLEAIPGSITSLQPDRDYLFGRIHESLRSFYPVITEPGVEKYCFVLEDLTANTLVGTSSIYAKTGGFEPSYTYEIVEESFEHKPLGIETRIAALHLRIEHAGSSELGGLFLLPDFRHGGLGGVLSRGRLLFARLFPERFTRHVTTEFRGLVTDGGEVPFWEAIGRHFFVRDFFSLDQYSATARKDFIHDLMPRHPIYVPLLPQAAQDVIGKVHPATEPAVQVLVNEGLRFANQIDIFDGGPIYQAAFADTHTFGATRQGKLAEVADSPLDASGDGDALRCVVSNAAIDFRATVAHLRVDRDGDGEEMVTLSRGVAEALMLSPGDNVQFLPKARP